MLGTLGKNLRRWSGEKCPVLTSARSGQSVHHQHGHKNRRTQDNDNDSGQTVLLHFFFSALSELCSVSRWSAAGSLLVSRQAPSGRSHKTHKHVEQMMRSRATRKRPSLFGRIAKKKRKKVLCLHPLVT